MKSKCPTCHFVGSEQDINTACSCGTMMLALEDVQYPQHEKAKELEKEMQGISQFLQYLDSKGIQLVTADGCILPGGLRGQICTLHNPVRVHRATLIAECLDIDEKAMEAEKEAMFTTIREGD